MRPPRGSLLLGWRAGTWPNLWPNGALGAKALVDSARSCSQHLDSSRHSRVHRAYRYGYICLPFTPQPARSEREYITLTSPSIAGKNTLYPCANISRRLLPSFVYNAALLGSGQFHNQTIDCRHCCVLFGPSIPRFYCSLYYDRGSFRFRGGRGFRKTRRYAQRRERRNQDLRKVQWADSPTQALDEHGFNVSAVCQYIRT